MAMFEVISKPRSAHYDLHIFESNEKLRIAIKDYYAASFCVVINLLFLGSLEGKTLYFEECKYGFKELYIRKLKKDLKNTLEYYENTPADQAGWCLKDFTYSFMLRIVIDEINGCKSSKEVIDKIEEIQRRKLT